MALIRDYFSYTVILADTADLDNQQNAKLKALSGVSWSVQSVDSAGNTSSATIYSGRTGSATSNSGTTTANGLIEFWAEPGEYRVNITDAANRISSKSLTWSSVPGQDGSIPGDFISNDNKLDLPTLGDDIKRQLVPVGAVIDWWRPDVSVNVPSGFAICEGQSISSSNHDFGTGQAITLPDLRNKFVIGANKNNSDASSGSVGTSASNAPGIRGEGGSNGTKDLTHTHTVYKHNHTLSTSSGRATFSAPSYSFSGNAMNLSHHHNLYNDYDSHRIMWRTKNTATNGNRVVTNIYDNTQGVNTSGYDIDFAFDYRNLTTGVVADTGWDTTPTGTVSYSSGGSIGGKAGLADGTGVRDGDTDVSTSPATANITNTHDFRPAYVGLLKIMKVKWS